MGQMDHSVELNSNTGDTFVDKSGNIHEAGSAERDLCFHKYVNVIRLDHELHSDGSCTTLYYDAKRCIWCAALKDVKLNSGLNCKKCPH